LHVTFVDSVAFVPVPVVTLSPVALPFTVGYTPHTCTHTTGYPRTTPATRHTRLHSLRCTVHLHAGLLHTPGFYGYTFTGYGSTRCGLRFVWFGSLQFTFGCTLGSAFSHMDCMDYVVVVVHGFRGSWLTPLRAWLRLHMVCHTSSGYVRLRTTHHVVTTTPRSLRFTHDSAFTVWVGCTLRWFTVTHYVYRYTRTLGLRWITCVYCGSRITRGYVLLRFTFTRWLPRVTLIGFTLRLLITFTLRLFVASLRLRCCHYVTVTFATTLITHTFTLLCLVAFSTFVATLRLRCCWFTRLRCPFRCYVHCVTFTLLLRYVVALQFAGLQFTVLHHTFTTRCYGYLWIGLFPGCSCRTAWVPVTDCLPHCTDYAHTVLGWIYMPFRILDCRSTTVDSAGLPRLVRCGCWFCCACAAPRLFPGLPSGSSLVLDSRILPGLPAALPLQLRFRSGCEATT